MFGIGAAFPLQVEIARLRSVEIVFDGETHEAGETLRVLTDEKDVVRFIHDLLCYQRRCANSFEACHGAAALPGAVHDGSIELHHAVRIGKADIAHAGVFRIKLDDVDTGDAGVHHIGAFGNHLESFGHAGQPCGVLRAVPVAGGHHDRFHTAGNDLWSPRKHSNCGACSYKLSTIQFVWHGGETSAQSARRSDMACQCPYL